MKNVKGEGVVEWHRVAFLLRRYSHFQQSWPHFRRAEIHKFDVSFELRSGLFSRVGPL